MWRRLDVSGKNGDVTKMAAAEMSNDIRELFSALVNEVTNIAPAIASYKLTRTVSKSSI